MRFAMFEASGTTGLAVVEKDGSLCGLLASEAGYPGSLQELIVKGGTALAEAGKEVRAAGRRYAADSVSLLPPLHNPPKIICIGLNYAEHSSESGFTPPDYPTVFARFASSLIGADAPLRCPPESTQFDYEGELVAVIGRGGRRIARGDALAHVAGYSIFNDVSVRDYQLRTPQWTVGKNFDYTGAFGPHFVTPDELPAGATGLRLQTRLNGQVVQNASTSDLIFDVANLIALLSVAFTLEAGDVIVTGTPSGVGVARKPPLYMKAGDVCEVEIEGLGILRNPVVDEVAA